MGAYQITEGHAKMMRDENELKKRITASLEADEGRKNYVYDDATGERIHSPKQAKGNPTIGVGYKLRKGDESLYGQEVDDTWIDSKRDQTMNEAIDLARYVTKKHREPFDFDKLPLNQKEAIVNIIFNVGAGEFATWKNTLDYLAAGNFKEASKEILRGRTKDSKSKYASGPTKHRALRVSKLMSE